MIDNKKKISLILLIMALSACNIASANEYLEETVFSVPKQEDIKVNRDTLEIAQEAMKEKDYQSAIVLLTAYINSRPKRYEAYKYRGECFYALRQYKLAQSDFQTAIDLKTDDDKFLTGTKYVTAVILGADKQEQLQNPELGNLYGELMYAQKALNNPAYEVSYDEAVKYNSHIYLPKPKKDDITKINCPQKYGKMLNPQGVDAEIASVIEDIEAGKFHEALYKTPSITENYPKYYLGYYLSGIALAGMEQTEDAINAFKTALKYNPYDFESYASLGEIYYSRAEKTFSQEDTAKSKEYFEQALRYNPNCNTYHFYIGLNDMLMKDYQSAIDNFSLAIKEKSNDYNSIYYKTIAQYLNGDYKSAEDSATKLLYRHVSNYNSVLYLRALAKFRQNNYDEALADIEKIHNNINDIYNADIKPLSDKEKALISYLYYLKSEILKSKGLGTKADLQKATENSVIANFVSSSSEMILNPVQIDNQFDFIRTTFIDYDLNYTYLNPDYKLSYTKKPVQNTVSETAQSDDDIAKELQPSLAQVLASRSLYPEPSTEPETVEIDDVVKITENTDKIQETEKEDEEIISASDEKSIIIEALKNTPETAPTETAQKPSTLAASSTNPYWEGSSDIEVEDIIATEVSEEPVVELPKSVIIEAPEKRETQDFRISYEIPKLEQIIVETEQEILPEIKEDDIQKVETVEEISETAIDEKISQIQNTEETVKVEVEQKIEETPHPKTVNNIVEKHANVDLSEFEVPKRKAMPEIKDTDEVIVFEPKPIFPREEQNFETGYNGLISKLANAQPLSSESDLQPEVEFAEPENVQIENSHDNRIKTPTMLSDDNEIKPNKAEDTVLADNVTENHLDELSQMLSELAEVEKQTGYTPEINIIQNEEKPVKEKRGLFRKKKKSQDVVTPAPEIIAAEETPETVQDNESKEIEPPDKTDVAVSSIVQSVFNGDDDTKTDNPEVQQDENLEVLDEVQPLEEEKPVKEKRHWFKKRAKTDANMEISTETEDVAAESEDVLSNEPAVIEPEIQAETETQDLDNAEKPQRFAWFKRLFKKKNKIEETPQETPEVEPIIQLEPELQDTINDSMPKLRMEKAVVETTEEVEVSEIKPEKKKFNWFKKSSKSQEISED
ncbi:MAG: tetratricopeptide repeat protein [Candidatus Gastranaerophilaceae bacterium]